MSSRFPSLSRRRVLLGAGSLAAVAAAAAPRLVYGQGTAPAVVTAAAMRPVAAHGAMTGDGRTEAVPEGKAFRFLHVVRGRAAACARRKLAARRARGPTTASATPGARQQRPHCSCRRRSRRGDHGAL